MSYDSKNVYACKIAIDKIKSGEDDSKLHTLLELLQMTKDKDDLNQLIGYAAARGTSTIIKKLLEQGVDINIHDIYLGSTPLTAACSFHKYDIVVELLKNNANVNLPATNGWYPLHCVIKEDDYSDMQNSGIKTLKLLIAYKVDINVQNNYLNGETALMRACKYNINNMVYELLNANADIYITNHMMQTALYIAKEKNNYKAVRMINFKIQRMQIRVAIIVSLMMTKRLNCSVDILRMIINYIIK